MISRLRPPRLPRLALTAWVLAAAAFTALVLAVWHYLRRSDGSLPGAGMAGMHMPAGEAWTRAGAGPLRPLFGSAILTSWQLDSIALAVLVLALACYLTGVALVPLRHPGTRWPIRRTISFLLGLVVCGLATNGSIAVYDQVLFTAHMAQHLALVMLAPALLMAGRPLTLALAATADPARARIERIVRGRVVSLLTAPPVALASYTVVIVGSHLTGLMTTIMRSTWAGQLEHLVYLLVGCQFFVLLVGDQPIRWRLAAPARWLLLAVGMAVDTFTGVVLLQGTQPVGMLGSAAVHVNALSDTHTGGAIMWFGGDAIMAVVMIALVVGWLREADAGREEPGWLEQARRATFDQHTGTAAPSAAASLDDDDDAVRASYNAWLADLDRRS